MTEPLVVEAVLFETVEGVSDAQFLAAADQIQQWLAQQPGYIRRELAHTGAGQWLDLVSWRSLDDAHQAAAQLLHQPEATSFLALIREESIQMHHLHQRRRYD